MDNCVILRRDNHIILKIHSDHPVITYTISKTLIIFEMDGVTIEYKKNSLWSITNLHCKSLNMEFINMSVLAITRMICLYNIDVAYRWFMKTHETAVKLSDEIYENHDYCDPSSQLFSTSMSRNTSFDDLSHIEIPSIPSRNATPSIPSRMVSPCIQSSDSDDSGYIMTKSIIIKRS